LDLSRASVVFLERFERLLLARPGPKPRMAAWPP